MSAETSILRAALACAGRGWPVFPTQGIVEGRCTCGEISGRCSPGKHPRTQDGHRAATTDPQQVRSWWNRWPDANLAIRTGMPSGLVVLDIDGEQGERSWSELQAAHVRLPLTLEVRTGGGRHLYFRHPADTSVPCSTSRLAPGIDVRADGGYVLAPPSRHESGVCYRWISPPDTSLCQLPTWVLELLLVKPDSHRPGHAGMSSIPQGARNHTLTSLAGSMRHRGLEPDEILPALLAVNQRRCVPPLPVVEVRRIAWSVGRYRDSLPPPEVPRSQPVVVPLASVQPVPLTWLWPERIPQGKLTLLAGDPGLGKSLLALDIAARVSSGADWPDTNTAAPKGSVVLLSAEDDPADTVRPRLDAASADVDRIILLSAVDEGGHHRCFDIGRDIALLRQSLQDTPDVKLLVIDPLSAYLGSIDSHANTDVRHALAPLAALAAEHDIAVLAITHLRKAGGKALYRMMGSLAFVAAARAAWLVEKDSGQDRRLLLPVKTNLSSDQTGLAYTIASGDGGPVVCWQHEPIDTHDGRFSPDQSAVAPLEKAIDLLTTLLADGPKCVGDVEREARQAGVSLATLKRARASLGVQPRKIGFQGQWHLVLPKDAHP